MKHTLVALGVIILTELLSSPVSFGDQIGNPRASGGSNDPLTPAQIVSEFTRLPLETQKSLIKILMSANSADERRATTQELDAIYATLPSDVQRDLYAKWDALSDEQRIGLRGMDPAMIKSMLGAAILAEIGPRASDVWVPAKKMLEHGASLAEESRAYIQNLIYH